MIKHMSDSNNSYDQTEQNYDTISRAISAKPAILQALLKMAQQLDVEYTAASLKKR